MTETPDVETERILTLRDRCDRCISQAFVRVIFEDGLLDFCGHHYHDHEDVLATLAVEIIDERKFIDA